MGVRPTRYHAHGPAVPLPRTGIACAAAATVLFFAAVGGLPRDPLRAYGIPVLVALLSALAVVLVAGRPSARRVAAALVTTPYALLLVAAIGLDAFLLRQGGVPATLVGLLPAAGGMASWPRRRYDPKDTGC